uniref:DUF3445 domain-containing protein n=1 Tax=Cyanothece sp. (strain PCC 7425 / ATCC 29141) TaxID=395961 RepID=B8HQ35_CYAP4
MVEFILSESKYKNYSPFDPGKVQLKLGVQPLALPEWIEIDQNFASQLAEKEKLLRDRPSQVLVSLAGSEVAQSETLELLLSHLQTYFEPIYQWDANQITNRLTGQVWQRQDYLPLDLAGRLVQEDWVLLRSTPNGYQLAAGSVCFPLRWDLREKLGKPLSQIHAPVPGYETIAPPVDHLFDRLKPEYPIWRMNWTIVATANLFLPPDQEPETTEITCANAGETLWLRMERQTLRRLPQTGYVLFGIHTHVYPLHILAAHPQLVEQLVATIAQMPEPMLVYKNIHTLREPLLSYLHQFK